MDIISRLKGVNWPTLGKWLFHALFIALYLQICIIKKASVSMYLLSTLIAILRYRFLSKNTEIGRPGRFILWGFMEFNFPIYVFMQLKFWPERKLNENLDLFFVSLCVMLIFFIFFEVLSTLKIKKLSREYEYSIPFSKGIPIIFILFVLFSVGIAILGSYLQIGKMGIPDPELPFKLQKIIQTTRMLIIPFIGLLFLDYFYELTKKPGEKYTFSIITFLFIVLFTLLESFLRGTRGMIFTTGLLLIIWRILKGNISKRQIMAYFLIFLPIFITGYFLFTSVRSIHTQGLKINYKTISQQMTFFNPFTNFNTYHRLFGNGYEIDKFSKYLPSLWKGLEWSTFTEIEGAGIGYHTQVVDKVKINQGHSSGINGISDGFLAFGFPGVIILTVFFCICMYINDFQTSDLLSLNAAGRAQIYLLILLMLFGGIGSISFLFRNPFYHLTLIVLFILQRIVVRKVANDVT